MISEEEAFWAGIAVATMMLGGGFSMLFLRTYTGYGAVVLAIGLLTMAMTIQLRAKPDEHVEAYAPTSSPELKPTPPIQSTEETSQPQAVETKAEQSVPNEPPKESAQQIQPQPTPTQAEPVVPPQPQASAPSVEPPKIEEKPKEEPQVAPPAA